MSGVARTARRGRWRAKHPFQARAGVHGERDVVVPAGATLSDYQGPSHNVVRPGNAPSFDFQERRVSFVFDGERLTAKWREFHDVGDCEEIQDSDLLAGMSVT
jgi:hypothetical protein